MFLLTLAAIFGGMAIYLHGQEKMAPPPPSTASRLRAYTSTKLRSLKGSAKKENDKKQKTRLEKKLLKQAQQLYKKKNPTAAAQILESIGMEQEAVMILQKSQKFVEAGKLASRAGMHKRAGRIFAKIKQWEHAASNFKQAGMFEEAGQCYHQFGDYSLALECFKQTNNYDAVAKCYTILQEYRKAAMTYLRFKKVGKAVPLYQKMYQENPDRWSKTKFTPEELKAFSIWIKAGNPDLALAWTLYHAKKLSRLILDLAEDGEVKLATKIFVKDPNEFDSSLASQLVAEVRYETEQAANLVQIFRELGHHYHQGIVLEKLERFKEAAEAFRHSGEVSRAVHCYQRAGLPEEANKLESDESNAQKAHSEKIAAQKAKLSGESHDFSLEGVSHMSDVDPAEKSAAFEKEENTKILAEEKPGEGFVATPPNQSDTFNYEEANKQVPQMPVEQVPAENPQRNDIQASEPARSFESHEQIETAPVSPAQEEKEELSSNDLFSTPAKPSESQEAGLTTNDLFSTPQNTGKIQETGATPNTQFSSPRNSSGDQETGFTANDLFGAPPNPKQSQENFHGSSDQFGTPAKPPGGEDSTISPNDMFSAPSPKGIGETNISPNDMFSPPASPGKGKTRAELELDITAISNQQSPGQPTPDNSQQVDLNINLDQPIGKEFSQVSDTEKTIITPRPIQGMEIKPSDALDSPAAELSPNLNQEPNLKDQSTPEDQKMAQDISNSDPLSDIFSSFGADSSSKNLAKSTISDSETKAFYSCPLFINIPTDFIDKVWQLGHIEKLKKNDSIMTLQDHPLGVYIILSGTVVCESEGDHAKQRRLVATECFGETSVFASNPTGATFTAVKDSLILKINATKFKNLMQKDYSMAVQLFKNYTDRLLSPTTPSEFIQKNRDNS